MHESRAPTSSDLLTACKQHFSYSYVRKLHALFQKPHSTFEFPPSLPGPPLPERRRSQAVALQEVSGWWRTSQSDSHLCFVAICACPGSFSKHSKRRKSYHIPSLWMEREADGAGYTPTPHFLLKQLPLLLCLKGKLAFSKQLHLGLTALHSSPSAIKHRLRGMYTINTRN